MKRWGLGWRIAIAVGLLVGVAEPAAAGLCSAQLEAAIDAVIDAPPNRDRWGVLVRSLPPEGDRPVTLYAREADRFFIPASNAKLLVTAAALRRLGPQFQIETTVYQEMATPDAVRLRVVGRGDPSVTDAELATLAAQLKAQGIQIIDQLWLDDQFWRGESVPATWEWEDVQAGYGAPATPLMVNQNALGLTLVPQAVGQPLKVLWDSPQDALAWQVENRSQTVAATEPEWVSVGRDFDRPVVRVAGQLQVGAPSEPVAVAVTRPTENFLRRFRQSLTNQGIEVRQAAIAPQPRTDSERAIARIQSPPLVALLQEANRFSDNLYAEALLRTLGAVTDAEAETSTLEAGLEVLESTLSELGVDPESYALVDGSGLSRQNLVSPAALVDVLTALARSPEADLYRETLAIAGQEGTLRQRLSPDLQGQVQAKTGTLTGISALSGYLLRADETLVFSILVNQSDQRHADLTAQIDQIVRLLSQRQAC